MRVKDHPIIGKAPVQKSVTIYIDGEPVSAQEGESIAAALVAAGRRVFRYTRKQNPRGFFCGIGRCTDCNMTVNGNPQVRTCITPVEEGMRIETQNGVGEWRNDPC